MTRNNSNPRKNKSELTVLTKVSELATYSGNRTRRCRLSQIRSLSRYRLLTYKAERAGIKVVLQEESYTSKADFLAHDFIPVYGVNDADAAFSGRRKHRGLYRSSTGMEINADLNGAANILRKAIPGAFDKVEDFGYLGKPRTLRFDDINRKSIPDEGVVVS